MPTQVKGDELARAIARRDWDAVKALVDPIALKLAQAAEAKDWDLAHDAFVAVEKEEKGAQKRQSAGGKASKGKGKPAKRRPRPWPEKVTAAVLKKKMKAKDHDAEAAAKPLGVGAATVERWLAGESAPIKPKWAKLYKYCGIKAPK